MDLYSILLLGIKTGTPFFVKKIGEDLWKKICPPIEKARKSAVKRMAEELGSQFPSINFLELNFQFDAPIIKDELQKLISYGEKPNEVVITKEMATEISRKWPQYTDRSAAIVESFLKYFEEECLLSEDLKGFELAAIIKAEGTATRQVIQQNFEDQKDYFETKFSKLNSKLDLSLQTRADIQEKVTPQIIAPLEERLVKERDDLIDLIKKWHSAGLYEKIQKLAEDTLKVYEHINPIISGSIFRFFGSFILRSMADNEQAKYWIDLAEEVDPKNHKTIALKTELLCMQSKWKDAKAMLEPIADISTEATVKIIYAECLFHVLDRKEAFSWLKSQTNIKEENDDIKLNLAILATENGDYDFALDSIKTLKEKTYPGPYPYFLTSEILVKKAMPKDLISIAAPEDLEMQKNNQLLSIAIENLKKGVELIKLTSKPITVIAHFVHQLSQLYTAIGDITSAEKYLCQYWKQLRKQSGPWFTASSIAFSKGEITKALIRAQKAKEIAMQKDSDDSLFRFALLCINIEKWDECLEAINSLSLKELDADHLKALFQMQLICYTHKEDIQHAEEAILALKREFPEDDIWVIHKSLILSRQERYEDAIDILKNESINYPSSLKIRIRLASLYRYNKNFLDALPLYKDIAHDTGSADVFEIACWIAFDADKPDESLAIIDDAERMGVISENLRHYKAIALSLNKQYDEAIALFSSFQEESLTNNDYVAYAFCYSNRARPNEAIDLLIRAKYKYPEDSRTLRMLYILYLEINKPELAFKVALILHENNPDDKSAYFAVIKSGFAIGEGEIAHRTMMEYLSRFGEGPELRTGNLEEIKEVLKVQSEKTAFLWGKYQEGLLPELFLAQNNNLGIGGYRILLLNTPARVMAFDGNPESQRKQLVDSLTEKNILIDYQALITISLLDLFEPTLTLFPHIYVPETVLHELRENLSIMSTSYQKDRRYITEAAFLRVKDIFRIVDIFPEINPKDIPESLGNAIYDLLACKDKNCTFVTTGYESREISEILTLINSQPLSILDLTDLMKEKGIITIKVHEDIIETLKKYNLIRLRTSDSIPNRLMFDWQALEMLEECKILGHVPRLVQEIYVGPFSYAAMRADIERYRSLDNIIDTLRSIENKISELVSEARLIIVPASSRKIVFKVQAFRELKNFNYIEELMQICKESRSVLWTDELYIKILSSSEAIDTTCTRTILDVLLMRAIINQENHVHKIVQLLKWNMYFCWINSDLILGCSEMYDYSMNEDLRILLAPLTGEIQKMSNLKPNEVESSNFKVASICIRELWVISEKAQSLAMQIFDEIYSVISLKQKLIFYWISKCIFGFISLGELPLREFLKLLALRLPGQIKDDLKEMLKTIIAICLKDFNEEIVQSGQNKLIVSKLISAVGSSIPSYKDELRNFAIKLDPSMRALI